MQLLQLEGLLGGARNHGLNSALGKLGHGLRLHHRALVPLAFQDALFAFVLLDFRDLRLTASL